MIEIRPCCVERYSLSVPGSKSYTHRALVAASLSNGISRINGVLKSHDTIVTCNALQKLGVTIISANNCIIVRGLGGNFGACKDPIFLENSGTSMRFFSGLVILGQGSYILSGSDRLSVRPIVHLIEAMRRLGVSVQFLKKSNFLPIKIKSHLVNISSTQINCTRSSQYLSTLLLVSPYFKNGLKITVLDDMVSRPYIDMTISVMADFGISVEREGYSSFFVPAGQSYFNGGVYCIEPDCSQACYFWAAAAITESSITVKGLDRDSKQGDIKFLDILEKMGCTVYTSKTGITVKGSNKLTSVSIDMKDLPDIVPTVAVVALFARGTTIISGISHLKGKESNRIKVVVRELRRVGAYVKYDDGKLIIKKGETHGAVIDTSNDHRIAMSFSLIGLKITGIKISNELCVQKSFPNFWTLFTRLSSV